MNTRGYDIDPKCPKCGDIYGFHHSKPHYENNANDICYGITLEPLREWLEYECNSCRYVIKTPTADTNLLPSADSSWDSKVGPYFSVRPYTCSFNSCQGLAWDSLELYTIHKRSHGVE